MKLKILILLVAMISINGQIFGNNELIDSKVEETKVLVALMTMEINGAIQLYSVLKEEIELIDTEVIQNVSKESTSNWQLAYNRDYFIGFSESEVEAVTPSNFKRIAKKYFESNTGLVASLGKRGFRYKNLPTIILFYNKQIIQGKALTKRDKLTVKDIKK